MHLNTTGSDQILKIPRFTSSTSPSGPAAPWLAAGLLLSGMGTVLLGPILPALSQVWHLPDYQAGLLLFAKFIGAFVGGSTVPSRLRNGIFFGLLGTGLGLTGFAYSEGLYTGAVALFIMGVGLGQLIASTNILAGRRYQRKTGSALSILNFFWSLGAVCIGLFVAALLPHHTLREFLLTFAAAFVVIAVGGMLHKAPDPLPAATPEPEPSAIDRSTLIGFGIMLFLYGGLETCLSQWITTYTLRYAGGRVLGGQSALVVLWFALTGGRALTSLALRWISETTMQRASMICAAIMIPLLAISSSARSVSICCVLLGLSLAPFFPSTFAQLLRRRPPARVAGFILAVSGLGAAGLTWLMGAISSQSGSLRVAMAVPFVAAVGLLATSFWVPSLKATLVALRGLPPNKFPHSSSAAHR